LNEKWFNYAIALTIVMIFVNAFISIGASQPNADGTSNLYLVNNVNNAFSYANQKSDSNFYTSIETGDSSQSPLSEQGFTPIKRGIDANPVGFNGFDAAVTMALGIELVMLSLAAIFGPIAPLFFAFAALAFFIKAIAVAWLGSLFIRAIFGWSV
jgi:hypothetical protein